MRDAAGSPMAPHGYRALDADRVIATLEVLRRRVVERFPEAGLGRVAGDLQAVAREVVSTTRWLDQPHWGPRIAACACVLTLLGLWIVILVRLDWGTGFSTSSAEFLQGLDAGLNELVLFGATAIFLWTLENRNKRRRALRVLHQLRSLAHVIDMHQLTKDPAPTAAAFVPTSASPARSMTPYDLGRYLDYCSEMLSLIGKLAALMIQRFDDPVTLAAVDEIENLTIGMSGKIWQKISIVQRIAQAGART